MKKILTTVGITLIALSALTTSSFAVGDPRATGDLIAHELNTPGLGWAGHVGIWDNSRKRVLEILNKPKALELRRDKIRTLSQFKSGTRAYWGARYGRGWSHYRVINAGRAQRAFNPSYTISSSYTEGKYVKRWKWSWRRGWYKVTRKVNAKFRCDTFVVYCYKKGIGLNLLSRYTPMTPRSVFYSMPYAR
jgi:hypothetical protein